MTPLQRPSRPADIDVVDDLQHLFTGAVAEQVRRLEAALDAFRAGSPPAEETIRRLAHAAAGSGASCGFPAVTESARVVETAPADLLVSASERLIAEMRAMSSVEDRRLILIVDDDPVIARLLQMRLASPDRSVESVDTLTAASAALATRTPAAIVLDLFLPDGDGRTLLADLRRRDESADVPVIVISASGHLREECEALGADGFVAKPFDPEAVATLVSTALTRKDPSRSFRGGRPVLMTAFRTLIASGQAITVASVLPETHGPGGRSPEGPDPSVAATVIEAVAATLSADCTIAEWAEGEPAVVAPSDADVNGALDRARLRLRNHPHPRTPGAMVSFSAATLPDDGSGGLADAYARARQFALDANRSGGDRVVSPDVSRRLRRVLLAEDDVLTAALIINRLEQDGYEVAHFPDGASALEAAETTPFGLVVIDVHLPDLDGFHVLERIRHGQATRDVPILVVAAAGNERDIVRGFELGADDYILKPFSAGELAGRLRRITRSRHQEPT